MILFLMSLISKQISRDWDLTTRLLQGTLDSLANQTDQNFKVIIGCHEIPEIQFKGDQEKINFVQVEHSPTGELGRPPVRDIYIKLYTALYAFKDTSFDYCMVLDADDRIHKNLVSYIHTQPKMDAWVLPKGYELKYKSGKVFSRSNIDSMCGSTVFLSRKVLGIPQVLTREELKNFYYTAQGHNTIRSFCAERDLSLGTVPFYAVQYTVNHGLNWSDIMRKGKHYSQLKRLIKLHLLSRKMSHQELENFGYLINSKG